MELLKERSGVDEETDGPWHKKHKKKNHVPNSKHFPSLPSMLLWDSTSRHHQKIESIKSNQTIGSVGAYLRTTQYVALRLKHLGYTLGRKQSTHTNQLKQPVTNQTTNLYFLRLRTHMGLPRVK